MAVVIQEPATLAATNRRGGAAKAPGLSGTLAVGLAASGSVEPNGGSDGTSCRLTTGAPAIKARAGADGEASDATCYERQRASRGAGKLVETGPELRASEAGRAGGSSAAALACATCAAAFGGLGGSWDRAATVNARTAGAKNARLPVLATGGVGSKRRPKVAPACSCLGSVA